MTYKSQVVVFGSFSEDEIKLLRNQPSDSTIQPVEGRTGFQFGSLDVATVRSISGVNVEPKQTVISEGLKNFQPIKLVSEEVTRKDIKKTNDVMKGVSKFAQENGGNLSSHYSPISNGVKEPERTAAGLSSLSISQNKAGPQKQPHTSKSNVLAFSGGDVQKALNEPGLDVRDVLAHEHLQTFLEDLQPSSCLGMAFEATGIRYKNAKQRVFALAFPFSVESCNVGNIVIEFEKHNLNLEDLKFMGVRRKFAETHLAKPGRTPPPDDSYPDKDWVYDLICGPLVAMVLLGEDAVNKVCEIISQEKQNPFTNRGVVNFYSSDSVKCAEEDIDMWFLDKRDEEFFNSGGARNSKDLFFAFPDGSAFGAKNIFDNTNYYDRPYCICPKLEENFLWNDNVFVLIKSIAFEEKKVGEIIRCLEHNCYSFRGMKLVKNDDFGKIKARCSDLFGEIGEDKVGIAVLLDKLKNVDSDDNETVKFKHPSWCDAWDPSWGCMEIKRKFIYQSKPGKEAWELAAAVFKFGAVSWLDHLTIPPYGKKEFFGGIFQAALIGLID